MILKTLLRHYLNGYIINCIYSLLDHCIILFLLFYSKHQWQIERERERERERIPSGLCAVSAVVSTEHSAGPKFTNREIMNEPKLYV